MSFFNSTEPIFRAKQHTLDFQDLQGLLKINLKISNKTLFNAIYTRIDQVFVFWGLITATIFSTAQFAPISWLTQALIWSILSVIGTALMFILTHFWVKVEKLRWVLYSWVSLMLAGVVITDCGIFLGMGTVLMYLCHIWLALSAVGYLITGFGLRSRAFFISAIVHVLGIFLLPYFMGWQFLFTGGVMVANLLVYAETQWDMRPPINNYALLSEKQKEFNRQQYELRQLSSCVR